MTYTIIIPVYNEYLVLPSLLNKLKKLNLNENIETIIIDDGSYDGTKDLLNDKGFYELITYKTNLGKGAALKAALDKAGVSDFGGWKEDQYGVQQVSREMFVIPLVKAVQELSTKVDALEAEIVKLKG